MTYASTILADTPVAYWPLGEASGNPQDSSGNGHHVTVVIGSPTYGVAGPVAGTTAIAFSGTGQAFTVPSGIDVEDVFTLEAWVIPGATGASRGVLNLAAGQYLRIINTGQLTLSEQGVGIIVRSTSNPAAGGWRHIVATKNGATSKLYIDAVDVTGTVTDSTFFSFAGVAHIAESNSSNERFNGSIGQAAVYDYALTSGQVSAHYHEAFAQVALPTAASLVLSGSTPTLNAGVLPTSAALVLTGSTPVVTVSSSDQPHRGGRRFVGPVNQLPDLPPIRLPQPKYVRPRPAHLGLVGAVPAVTIIDDAELLAILSMIA